MATLPAGELSKHPSKGYRLTCGTYVGPDGKRRPKVFWLGQQKDKALLEAAKIRWCAWVAASEGGWNASVIARMKATDTMSLVRQRFVEAEMARRQLTPHLPAEMVINFSPTEPPASTNVAPAASSAPTFHSALTQFVESVQQQPLSRSHRKTIGDSIVALKRYLSDRPLDQIDYARLEKLTNYLKSRPLSLKKDALAGKPLPIRPYTVRRLLQHLRLAIQWISRQQHTPRFGRWQAPPEWRDLFSVELKQLMTKTERDRAADGPEQLTIDEIVQLYRAACESRSKLHPILLLLGLFAGLGQTELSTVRRDEIDLDSATFTHRRNKTGQKGVYWLPPELLRLLRKYFREHPAQSDELAFRTRDGQPLVSESSDSVRQAWDDWRKRSGVQRHGIGFYALRRYFGDYATRAGGEAIGDAALAHTAKTVRGKHYSGFRDFDKLREASQNLSKELRAAGMFARPKTKNSRNAGAKTTLANRISGIATPR